MDITELGAVLELVSRPHRDTSEQSRANKRMPALTTLADGDLACAIAVTRNPATGAYVGVMVNGIVVTELGDGTRIGAACYYSGDLGTTARAWGTVVVGDTCHWNGSVAGYELAPTDVIDFIYEEGPP